MKEQPPVDPQTENPTEEQGYEAIRKDAKKDYILACVLGGMSLITAIATGYNETQHDGPLAVVDGVLTLVAAGAGLYNRRTANDGFQRALMLEQANEYRGIIDAASNLFGEDLNEAAHTIGDATQAAARVQKISESVPAEPTTN